MEIGAALRDARESRSLSLEAISARTKIRVDQLRALESDAFERLPEPIFVRGFIRAYAREVGLDPVALVSHYRPGPVPSEPTETVADQEVPAVFPAVSAPSEDRTAPLSAVGAGIRGWVVAAAVIAPLLLYALALPLMRHPAPPAAAKGAPAEVAAKPVEEPPPTPVATSGTSLRIAIQVARPCWVSATADGRRVVFTTMRPDHTETIEMTSDLILRLGDAGAVSFSIDGARGRSLGRSGHPVTVRLTRDNYRSFLAAPRQ
jgi:helix-turn-helix protein/uncharacterized protein DUF4115